MSSERIALGQLEGVYPLLDLLQVGFVLIGPEREVQHASALAKRMLGRRIDRARLEGVLGDEYDDIVGKVLRGETWTTRWRDHRFSSPDGDPLDLAVRSVAIDGEGGARGALIAFYDVSVEVALHHRYKELLARQEAINEELRKRIAIVLREHEDDHAQFGELLQIAPAIFASFVGEADAAVAAVSVVVDSEEHVDEALVVALREIHTLKGNSRGLGLNFIAGRAHAVEDLLARARKLARLPDRAELAAGVADLRRAIDRAANLRGGLEAGAGATGDGGAVRAAALGEIADLLGEAAQALPGDHPLRERIDKALGTVDRMARIPLSQLLHYLRSTARSAAQENREEPNVDVKMDDVAVSASVHAALQTALPHLIRNAVVHGLEPADERVAHGKPSAGVITVEARLADDHLTVRVHDDGRGIDRDRLAAVLGDDGASLSDLVFHPGLSSKHGADLDAGRGMGALAARDALIAAGGTLAVETEPGRGTTFTARMPLGPHAAVAPGH